MSEYDRSSYYSYTGDTLRAYINKVLVRMGVALGITGAVAFGLYMSLISGGFFYNILVSAYTPVIVVVAIAQLVLCIIMSRNLMTMSTSSCTAMFYGYAALTGVTFSVLPLAFGEVTVFEAFLFSAVMFFSCAVIGYTTNTDLTKFGGLLFGGLIALVLVSLLSFFIPVLRESLLISYIGVLLFLGLTAYDMQKIKAFYYQSGADGTVRENLAVYGAFQLYLDFINLFLRVLQIIARSKNSRR